MDKIKKIRDMAKQYRQYSAECLSDMVKIPSLSAGEEKVVLKIKEQLKAAGVKDVRIDGLGNLIARVGRGPKILAFDAHIDTVDTGDVEQWDLSRFRD